MIYNNFFSVLITVLLISCNNEKKYNKKEEKNITDTIIKIDTVTKEEISKSKKN